MFIGINAGVGVSGGSSTGSNNTGVGYLSCNGLTSGGANTAFGYGSLQTCSTGSNNVALGDSALNSIGTGGTNVAVGVNAGFKATGDNQCTFVGDNAGTNANANATANNCFFGYNAGAGNSSSCTGLNNVAVGASSFTGYTSGSGNVSVGNSSGTTITTGSFNTLIGEFANTVNNSDQYDICIGYDVVAIASASINIGTAGNNSTCYIGGINGATVTGSAVLCSNTGQLGTISSSCRYKTNIEDLTDYTIEKVFELEPKSFIYKEDKSCTSVYGLIAEEVEKVLPELVLYKNGEVESVKYHEMPGLLIGAIKKLRKENEDLRIRLEKIEAMLFN